MFAARCCGAMPSLSPIELVNPPRLQIEPEKGRTTPVSGPAGGGQCSRVVPIANVPWASPKRRSARCGRRRRRGMLQFGHCPTPVPGLTRVRQAVIRTTAIRRWRWTHENRGSRAGVRRSVGGAVDGDAQAGEYRGKEQQCLCRALS